MTEREETGESERPTPAERASVQTPARIKLEDRHDARLFSHEKPVQQKPDDTYAAHHP